MLRKAGTHPSSIPDGPFRRAANTGILPVDRTKYKKVRNFISLFKDQTLYIAEQEIRKISFDFSLYVKQIIYTQKYKWVPLSDRYLASKKRRGLDDRILIATKEYIQSIKPRPRKRDGRVTTWVVGPGHHKTKHSSGVPMHQLGRWLEFGTSRMPARPHWRPAWSAFVRSRKLASRNIVLRTLREQRRSLR